ncbi:MAG: 3-methyl-2-oxobutanoate hydroxymethyltransferase [Burkholderiales bacterium]|nr:MAG: 3-methyl-2-oxobutanoate hydroxymethyltransferase [Betaproteobacteria bacterium]TAG83389.1 MAG: 3-methyl-2-oxobutanoate hydroxymethyltransferase [Burkholderiales bacterium]
MVYGIAASTSVSPPPSSTSTNLSAPSPRKAMNLHRIREMHASGEKIVMLTAYDATFAALADEAGVDCILVGDSLGMLIQGHASTVPVTLDQMVYHTQCVTRGNKTAWVIGDLPYGSYQQGAAQAIASATLLMQAGAHMVKLEGGGWTTEIVHYLTQRGIPVCAHLGLTPQSVHALGGYRVQGKTDDQARILSAHARELADAGAAMLVLELIPATLAEPVTQSLPIPTIGIGASGACSGQVLVLHDMLGLTRGKPPRFVKNFMADASSADAAIRSYVRAVKEKQFPEQGVHTY